ncbi:hypothetical protein LTR56_025072 [Elasticomyces elasticus]|nr:hypothetical protein LTR56_025072 [Elasticomyces elasticus]KAK3621254.1 hypothetical protein LTR22_025272 [Elasticomyces elasticus]KAK5741380.1 hypothetical protein LTS12_024639 [Elasticomyces elasticus]
MHPTAATLCQDQPFREAEVVSNEVDLDTALKELNNEGQPYNPAYDRRDMRRLGRVQEVKRRFRFFSLVGYMVILASTWEFAPPGYQKPLPYAVGWLCALGWQVSHNASFKPKSGHRANESSILQSAMPLISYAAAQQTIALIATCQGDFL